MGCHFLLQGNLPDPGFKPESHVPQADSLPSKPPGKPKQIMKQILILQMAAIISFCGFFLFVFFLFFFSAEFPWVLSKQVWDLEFSLFCCLNYILCPRAAHYSSCPSSTGAIFQEPLRMPETVDRTDSTHVFPYTHTPTLEPNLQIRQ